MRDVLHIRDIDTDIIKRVKSEAAISGVTMKEWVIDALEQKLGDKRMREQVSEELEEKSKTEWQNVVRHQERNLQVRESLAEETVETPKLQSKDIARPVKGTPEMATYREYLKEFNRVPSKEELEKYMEEKRDFSI